MTLLDQGVFSSSTEAPYEPSAYRPPGYTAFIALVACVSRATIAVQLLQIVLSVCYGILLFLVARRIARGTEYAVLWVGMLNPFDAVYSGAGLSECVTTGGFILIAAALAFLEGRRRLIVAGALLGVLCLFRDIYLALLPFGGALFLLAGGRQQWRARVGQVAAVVIAAALVIAPWTARNFMHFGRVIPISAGRLGYALWMGTWAVDGSFTSSDATGRSYPEKAFMSDVDRDVVLSAGTDIATSEPLFKRLFVERMKAEPHRVLGRWAMRWPRLWLGTRFDIFELNRAALPHGSLPWKITKAGMFGLNALFLAGAAVGAVLAWRARLAVRWAVLPVAFTSLIYLPLNSFENRYSQPMFPFLTLLIGVAVLTGQQRWLRGKPNTL